MKIKQINSQHPRDFRGNMKIMKDERNWQIAVQQDNQDCYYLDFPANIHRCSHPSVLPNGDHGGKNTLCNMDTCPIYVGEG